MQSSHVVFIADYSIVVTMSISTSQDGRWNKTILSERVVAEWMDEHGRACVLGSCLNVNKQKPEFLMTVLQDTDTQHFHIRFSLTVTVKPAGKPRGKDLKKILLIYSPDDLHMNLFTQLEHACKPIMASELVNTSVLRPSDLHEAGITDSDRILRVPFSLLDKGSIVVPDMFQTTSKPIQPTTTTSRELMRGLESLSNVLAFTLYIKPSSYADHGLKTLRRLLRETPRDVDVVKMYLDRGAMLMDYGTLDNGDRPPPYCEKPIQPSVHAPQSPPLPTIAGKEISPRTSDDEVRILETPTRTPARDYTLPPSPVSVLQGIFTSTELDLEAIESTPKALDWDFPSDHERMEETMCDSDEERYTREASQIRQDLSVSKALRLEFELWMKGAMTINRDLYEHPLLSSKLSSLGEYARESNLKAFDLTRCWCSTLLFYEPVHSDNTARLWDEANRRLVTDMAKLIIWANKFRRCVEMCSEIFKHNLVQLGNAARAVALQPGSARNAATYEDQRAVCVASIYCEFGKANIGVGGPRSKASISVGMDQKSAFP
jgi:hypothetical protein